ncbi:3-phosphoshikimate 1-carboxyvinyltransferase [Planococcus sp. NCCP-2050]|uniref:3-phosphoshikimate 1-carboxyvinyltransferase n=1 Tax=Planococcus sp. NCCP-2050 TaxID=2944679 RepID=UPI00204191ED|nr:3-phosphoshikimate 1-carboxyvinyltransferase [Planococcus sp. NCCP-2050]GKW46993.1 3-phosphoshikimate 1-carboxyvinyltransferase [Planococcus sp. NCCP-2050]
MSTPDLQARSPWSHLNDIESVKIAPKTDHPINGSIRIPGSKSFTNRALIMAALAKGHSKLSGILRSDDSYWCIDALNKLGIETEIEGDIVTIQGCYANWPNLQADLYIGAAGTTARFLPGALAAGKKGDWVVQASKRMSERPVEPLIKALIDLGAKIDYLEKEGFFPIQVKGSGLAGGAVSISGKLSSQFISGLLLASPYAEKEVTITIPDSIVQHEYVRITLGLMEKFGVKVDCSEDLSQMVVPQGEYVGQDLSLEADASTASYFFALAAVTNGQIRITNLSANTNQPDIHMLEVYKKMGCRVVKGEDYIELIGTDRLIGGFDISMKEMSDQTLTLAALAPFASGPITMRDVEHIRHHESDRISAICTELGKLGIKVEEFQDGLTVYPGTPQATTLNSYDDHRVAMSLALIGTKVPGVVIQDPGCISKTCPTYFELLQGLGISIEYLT